MNDQQQFVMSCIDGSKHTQAVCDYSSWIAKKVKVPLKLFHTIEHCQNPAVSDLTGAIGLGSSEELLNDLMVVEQNRSRSLLKQGQLLLDAAKERVMQAGIEAPLVRQRHGRLAESLIELEEQIRVLVVGIRGEDHQQDDAGVGTQLETVIRSLHKPILVVNNEFAEPEKVMLAYDGSAASKKALEMIAEGPLFSDILCHIVHVGENDVPLLEQASTTLQQAGIETTTANLSGKKAKALLQYQEDNQIDLTIMGAFTHNRLRDFIMGSLTEKMLAQTNRPLLLLR